MLINFSLGNKRYEKQDVTQQGVSWRCYELQDGAWIMHGQNTFPKRVTRKALIEYFNN